MYFHEVKRSEARIIGADEGFGGQVFFLIFRAGSPKKSSAKIGTPLSPYLCFMNRNQFPVIDEYYNPM
jgi:hypothetical protein